MAGPLSGLLTGEGNAGLEHLRKPRPDHVTTSCDYVVTSPLEIGSFRLEPHPGAQ